ncbi:hypothetical protein NFI96_014738, partial [Prochilodus magdalenae]
GIGRPESAGLFSWRICLTGMTPALSKSSNKVSRVHISSSVFTGHMESDGSVLSMDVDPPLKLLDDSYAHRFWLNLSSLPFLDSCISEDPLELTDMLLPSLFQSPESFKTMLLSNQEPLLELLSLDKSGAGSAASTSVSPDVNFPVYEDSRTTAAERHTSDQPDGSTEPYQGITQSCPPQQCSQRDSRSPDNGAQPRHPGVGPQESGRIRQSAAGTLRRIWHSSSQMEPSAMREALKARTKWLASEHGSLEARADRANRRLFALLGEHAVQHCANQLEGLGRKVHQEGTSFRSFCRAPGSSHSQETKALGTPVEQKGVSSLPECSRSGPFMQKAKDMQGLAQCGQAVLQEVQKAIDSDATASSSDEEWDHEGTPGADSDGSDTAVLLDTSVSPLEGESSTNFWTPTGPPQSSCLGCEWRWQCERAELASCWTWLQLRLSELDCRIQQLRELHRRLLACKGSVVLAESQPLTDRQIQQMLLTETAGLALTAGNMHDMTAELDTEPSSPTRLLWNIERQSAQLSQIVNSLMAPLSVSPSSSPVAKGPCSRWRGQQKRPFSSNKTEELLLLNQTNKDFSAASALCFTETWLSELTPDSALHLPGFQLHRADRDAERSGKSRGGGICFYINERWCRDTTVLLKSCSPHLESLFITCRPFYSPREFSSFILAGIYIAPSACTSDALKQLAEQITKVEREFPDSLLIILGDFNSANLTKEIPKYRQHIACPTREGNTLDKCYTCIKNAYRAVTRAAVGLSDHSLVHLIPTYRQKLKTNKPVITTVKRWTSGDIEKLQGCFESTNWAVFEEATDGLDEYTDTVTSYISFCEDSCISTKSQ